MQPCCLSIRVRLCELSWVTFVRCVRAGADYRQRRSSSTPSGKPGNSPREGLKVRASGLPWDADAACDRLYMTGAVVACFHRKTHAELT